MRPIVSAVGSQNYNLAKFLTKEFENSQIEQNSFCVKNSIEIIDSLKKFWFLP